ncbi:hypothetical protein TNCV_4676731 [Trichonephila clavipes]|nr:hypothetical protein TNCV_4676731 [Trichonephila clavipes]
MPYVRSRKAYQQVSDFDKIRIVAYRNCCLSYHSNAARIGPDPTTRLARHHTPIITAAELWYLVEAAWSSVTVHAIQSLFDSMPRRIRAVITA